MNHCKKTPSLKNILCNCLKWNYNNDGSYLQWLYSSFLLDHLSQYEKKLTQPNGGPIDCVVFVKYVCKRFKYIYKVHEAYKNWKIFL